MDRTEPRLRSTRTLACDAPVVSDVVELGDGKVGLRRRLHPGLEKDPAAVSAVLAEMEAGGKIPHNSRYCARLLAADDSASPWLIRRFAAGGTLAEFIPGKALQGNQLLLVAGVVMSGLRQLWSAGVFHGDPSPANVVLTRDGVPLLADACSARLRFATSAPDASTRESDVCRFLGWFYPQLRRAALVPQDRVANELFRCIPADWPPEKRFEALWQGVRGRGGEACTLLLAPSPAISPASESVPGPVPISISVGPVPDGRAAYLAARTLAPLIGVALPEVRNALAARAVVVGAQFPGPGLDALGQLETAGVKATVTVAQECPLDVDSELTAGSGAAQKTEAESETGRRPDWRRWRKPLVQLVSPVHVTVALVAALRALLNDHSEAQTLPLAHRAERLLLAVLFQVTVLHSLVLCLCLLALRMAASPG